MEQRTRHNGAMHMHALGRGRFERCDKFDKVDKRVLGDVQSGKQLLDLARAQLEVEAFDGLDKFALRQPLQCHGGGGGA